jgi:hypothetical protein
LNSSVIFSLTKIRAKKCKIFLRSTRDNVAFFKVVIGHWLLVIGYWSLVIGHLLGDKEGGAGLVTSG